MDKTDIYRNIDDIVTIQFEDVPDACKYCSNHPNNGGNGICNCTLGQSIIY